MRVCPVAEEAGRALQTLGQTETSGSFFFAPLFQNPVHQDHFFFLLLQDLTMTQFQVSADKQFVLLAYNIKPVSFPPTDHCITEKKKTLLCLICLEEVDEGH